MSNGLKFRSAFRRFRFGFANANVDNLDADLLQLLMRRQSAATTRHDINTAERSKRSGVAERCTSRRFSKARRAEKVYGVLLEGRYF